MFLLTVFLNSNNTVTFIIIQQWNNLGISLPVGWTLLYIQKQEMLSIYLFNFREKKG